VAVDRHVGRVEELAGVLALLLLAPAVDPGIDAVGLVEVSLQMAELDVYPAGVGPMDGRDVDHGLGAGNGR
jgi:hypothetical protein